MQRPRGRLEMDMSEQRAGDQSRHREGREVGGGASEGPAGRGLGAESPGPAPVLLSKEMVLFPPSEFPSAS